MRRYRTLAAPGDLRRWIVIQAEKLGVPIHYHQDASNNSHELCGTAHGVDNHTAARRYCPHCSTYYDVDENACRNMLRQSIASNGGATRTTETGRAASVAADNASAPAVDAEPSAPVIPVSGGSRSEIRG
jgi:transposase